MKKFFKCLAVLLVAFNCSRGQTAFEVEIDSFSIGSYPTAWNVIGTLDNGFVVGGFIDVGFNNCPYLIKFDSVRNFQWGKYYTGNNLTGNEFTLMQTPDSGYLIGLSFESNIMLGDNSWAVIKLDKSGTPIAGAADWASGSDESHLGGIYVEKSTGQILITGRLNLDDYNYLIIFDSLLSVISSHGLNPTANPGVRFIEVSGNVYDNGIREALILNGVVALPGNNNYLRFLSKIDTTGNIVWQKSYRLAPNGARIIPSSIVRVDSFYYCIAIATSYPYRSGILKTDLNGNALACMLYDSVQLREITPFDSSSLLISGVKAVNSNTLIMIRSDFNGNILNAAERTFSSYYLHRLDTISKTALDIPYDTIPGILIGNTSVYGGCGSVPIAINSVAEPVMDSSVSFSIYTGGWNSPFPMIFENPLTVVVKDNCVSATNTTFPSVQQDLSISPNPATTQLTLTSALLKQKSTIELFDITGRRVLHHKTSNSNQETTINVSAFERGIYMLCLSNEKENAVRKVVLQ